MPLEGAIFLGEFAFWCALGLAAPSLTLWAFLRPRDRRSVGVLALCLWCLLAGGTLMGSMWSMLSVADQQAQVARLANLPAGANPADAVRPMQAIVFFIKSDQLGRRLGYLTVIIPLLATAWLVRGALRDGAAAKGKLPEPEDELFTPYGP